MSMVDIHSHILPAIDDGSTSWDMTLEMCRMAADDGVTHMVATPHANSRYAYDRQSHQALLDELRDRMNGAMEFSLGCDFHLSYENVQAAMANPAQFTIGSTRYLLVELSDYSIAPQTASVLENFASVGVTPIVTHPERNPIIQRKPQMLFPWIEAGALIQVTANSLTGFWGALPKKVAELLLKEQAVHVLASDAHEATRRVPNLSAGRKAAAALVGEDSAEALVSANPQAIVRGQPIPFD